MRSLPTLTLILTLALSGAAPAQGADVVIGPFLQDAEPTSLTIVWETDIDDGTPHVDYGLTAALGQTASGTSQVGSGASRLHRVDLGGLSADTAYFYRSRTDTWTSSVERLRTPPTAASEKSFRFVVYSDSQGGSSSVKHTEIVNDGVIDFVTTNFGPTLADELAFVLVPGDLVSTGGSYGQWETQFFDEIQNLSQHVPYYPVAGNHEGDSPNYFQYFVLPENGTPGYLEHWYYKDYSNVRVIGLDSNSDYRIQAQLDWLDTVLTDACTTATIDLVFAQLHHPHKSELWTPGETDFSGDVVSRLEQFSTDCAKPSVHFFGHTHGYARGQSRDHQHLWINVASAEGNLDYWGAFPNADYDEIQRSLAEWGFMIAEVEAGASPSLRMRRVSRGNDVVARDNEIVDDFTLRLDNVAPDTPTGTFPIASSGAVALAGLELTTSAFVDADSDAHLETHVQVTSTPGDYASPVVEAWRRSENLYSPPGANGFSNGYFSVDTVAGTDLTRTAVGGLLRVGASYAWRGRYRDDAFGWSAWSPEQTFTTGVAGAIDDLYVASLGGSKGRFVSYAGVTDLATDENGIDIGRGEPDGGGIAWDEVGARWVYFAGDGSGRFLAYDSLSDLAAGRAATTLGEGDGSSSAISAGPGGWYQVDGSNVWHYATLADMATDRNFMLVGNDADSRTVGLTWNGTVWITKLDDGRFFSYPTITDVADDTNFTLLGTGDKTTGGIAYVLDASVPALASCPATPGGGCRVAGKSKLQIKDKSGGEKDSLQFRWQRGPTTTQTELGYPLVSTGYRLCVYDAAGLVRTGTSAAGGLCAGKNCWSEIGSASAPKGFRYKNKTGSIDCTTRVELRNGEEPRSKIIWKSKGEGLDDDPLGLTLPVVVEVSNNETPVCFTATFDSDDVRTNTAEQFKAGASAP